MTPTDLLASVEDLPAHEAERLLRAATGLTAAGIAACHELGPTVIERFNVMVGRRRGGEPLQFVEGTVQFGPLELLTDSRALIPRPETELLWEMAVAALGDAGPGTVIVDVGTGSGNLALALKHSFPEAQVFATDVSGDALALAKENAARVDLDVAFLQGSLLEPLDRKLMGRIDLLVANLPYVAEGDYAGLPPEVRDYEPRDALVAGPAGDEVLTALGGEAYWWLGVGGWAFIEIGDDQADRALEVFGGLDREVRPDLAGRDRILVGRKGASCCI